MRILIGTTSYAPNVSGVAIAVELLTKYLIAHGHQVFIVAPAAGLKRYTEVPVEGGPTVYRVRALPNPVRKGFFIPFLVKKEAKRIVREVRPDIVHLNDPLKMCLYMQEEARRLKIPVIASNHFLLDYVLAYFPRFLRPLYRLHLRSWVVHFYNHCDAIICPSQTAAKKLAGIGVRRKLTALSNGVDTHRFFTYFSPEWAHQELDLPDKLLVLYTGRLDKDKSLPVLIKAFKDVTPGIRAQLVIAGKGKAAASLRRLVRKQGLTPYVSWLGQLDHQSDELTALYQLADVFVMPSSIETQSISTLEAMAAGKPIVAANGGALPELVKDGVNGFLFPPGDETALANRLRELLQDSSLRQRFGQASLRLVAKHELDKSLHLFEQLYYQCLEKK